MARTQQQRREETVGRLLEACIATIIEVGYARASAAVITKRAGVSVGALFRHFETMGDFMAATASEVLRRQLELHQAGRRNTGRPAGSGSGADDSAGHHQRPGERGALRTDGRRTHRREAQSHSAAGARAVCREDHRCCRTLPGARAFPEDRFPVLVALVANVFDGAAMVEGVVPEPEIDEQQDSDAAWRC